MVQITEVSVSEQLTGRGASVQLGCGEDLPSGLQTTFSLEPHMMEDTERERFVTILKGFQSLQKGFDLMS